MIHKSILLINGSQVLMDITKKILERTGLTVRCAVGAAGAREQLLDFVPDGIILDCDLPDGDGFKLCADLRRQFGVPILLLSNDREDELLAFKAGAQDFLKKPYNHDIFKARVVILLSMVTIPSVQKGEVVQTPLEPPAPETQKKKRALPARNLTANIAACCILIFFGVGILFRLPANEVEILDEPDPLSSLFIADEGAVPHTGEEIGQPITADARIIVDAEMTADALLHNPWDSGVYMVFTIIDVQTEEPLYASGYVPPGMCVDGVKLNTAVRLGEMSVRLAVYSYTMDTLSPLDRQDTNFTLIRHS